MTTRFKNALDALVHAFFNDTLAKGICTACAVGNIVARGFGGKLNSLRDTVCQNGFTNGAWSSAFYTTHGIQEVRKSLFDLIGVSTCVSATGYSIEELMKIEYAFETSTAINFTQYMDRTKQEIMQDQYNGLMAVLDVLCEIEGIDDPSEYKQIFAFQA